MKNLEALKTLGQSLWYDNIQRSMLQSGAIARMIEQNEIVGMTSNPSIFHNAIGKSTDYNNQLQTLAWAGVFAEDIFWHLAIDDIQRAADLFAPVYASSKKLDGYVSIEVNPNLAHDTEGTVTEAISLWQRVARPNLMIKVPATKAGIPAIRKLIGLGINVNVTLIFSVERYREVAEAYIAGLEDRLLAGNPIEHVSSVASFFVSRVDTRIDGLLSQKAQASPDRTTELQHLSGKAGIYNSRLAYQAFQQIFASPRFQKLQAGGATYQRPLWASTSTKNPAYRDVIYVEELIGAHTVNTVPPVTLAAFLDHGKAAATIAADPDKIAPLFAALDKCGILINEVTESLESEGVQAFIDAFNNLIALIETKRKEEVARLGDLSSRVSQRLQVLAKTDFLKRLWQHDPGLWTESPDGQKEIRQRMDWLEAPWNTGEVLEQYSGLLADLLKDGFTNVLILGMGGSSLAPEVFSLIQAAGKDSSQQLKVSILDSTHPDEVAAAEEHNPLEKTLFVVSSKSGTTGEINAFYNYFYDCAHKKLGDAAGAHFMAITDPGTKLEQLAQEKHFRKIITANPRVGGRNSALTAFGLVPAALCGIDVAQMIGNVQFYGKWFKPDQPIESNPGIVLGSIVGEAALSGRDKLTILADGEWNALASWMEQLIAESSGKNGKGILPIAAEPMTSPQKFQHDRLFVYLRKDGHLDQFASALKSAGHPLVQLDVNSALDLGYQFYLWEVATAVACSILGVNSFDQPDVQDAKTRTLAGIEAYRKTGQFVVPSPLVKAEDFQVYSNQHLELAGVSTPMDAVDTFVAKCHSKSTYVAINAFIPRNAQNETLLNDLRKVLLERYGVATTLGFGPRYLHSTGQLHKGGPDNGLFLILDNTPERDISIPTEGITFGKFCLAQALGDEAALAAHGRKILRLHFTGSQVSLT
jgi:transaldolase/glucose-6-phosphate isomerase